MVRYWKKVQEKLVLRKGEEYPYPGEWEEITQKQYNMYISGNPDWTDNDVRDRYRTHLSRSLR